jgi:hypothetical protein
MPRKETLNEIKGKKISDLEAFLIIAEKLLEDKLQEKPKAGVTLAKGKPNERKVRYTEARETLNELKYFFEMKGCMSFGVCGTCRSLDQRSHGNTAFGTCRKTKSVQHIWDTCAEHSKEGGGYGL